MAEVKIAYCHTATHTAFLHTVSQAQPGEGLKFKRLKPEAPKHLKPCFCILQENPTILNPKQFSSESLNHQTQDELRQSLGLYADRRLLVPGESVQLGALA